jgi:4-oxalmesaconate hydratase
VDPETGHHYDDTGRYIEAAALGARARASIYADNARRVYSRLRV